MSQVITNAFEQYWQSSLAAEQPVVLDEFILADIPNLDITSPIDQDTGLPPESQIVHRQNVDQRGRLNNNAVAYTIVMDTTVGDFSFNAMYLRNKANGVIGMIVYKGRETKLKTDQTTGQTGNSLVKSMLMGYDQAAEATLTNVDAGTWQIDYAARLRGQDEDLRQLASQLYGHHTFIGDGFKVVQQDGGHQVTQGVAIVGGLRIELKQPQVIYPGTKPIGVWVDVHRSGSLLSEHQNHFTIITSVADLADHVDESGYQHYVAKLGTVQADNYVVDSRGNTVSGVISIPDVLARLEQTDDMLGINNWEALRRSYDEAGWKLRDRTESFEDGGILTSPYDVLLHKLSGKAYSIAGPFPQAIEKGTDPATPPFIDRSNVLSRHRTPEDFSGRTDHERVVAWLTSGGKLAIHRDYLMESAVTVSVSNATVEGHGRIIFPMSVITEGTVLRIIGNNNKFKEMHVIHQGSMLSAGALITVKGNKNRLDNVESTFLTEFNPSADGEQYMGTCIALDGDSNSAIECYGENGGTGVSENGKNNVQLRNNFDKCCRIAVNGNKSRHAIVDGNHGDCQHKGYPLQGCDGIWGNRSHRFTRYSNNTIINPGEHGAYLQGDGFTWDKTNRVEGAKKCLIKVGAKADGNYAYPGETLPLFDEFGVPSPTGVYSTTGAFIAPRGIGNNQSASSDGCVCLQPNIADLVTDEYEVIDNHDSPWGIRSLYFAPKDGTPVEGLQVLANLKVLDGKVLRSGPSSFACADNLEIDGFFSGRHINISAENAPQGTKNATIRAECPYINFTTAPDGIKILGGKYQYILESSGLNIEIFDTEITSQNLGGAWEFGRVVRLQDSKVKWLSDSVFKINGVNNIVDSVFDIPNVSESFPLQFNFNSNSPLQGHFDGNTIRAPLSKRPVRLGGKDATCNSNVIVGADNSDYTLTIQGENITAVGNSLNAGVLRLDSTAKNCFAVGRSISNGNEAGGNVVITN
jgi:hypothetical protein